MQSSPEVELAIAVASEAKKEIVFLTNEIIRYSKFVKFISNFYYKNDIYWGGREIYCDLAVSISLTASVSGYRYDEDASVFNVDAGSGKATTLEFHRLLDLLRRQLTSIRFSDVFTSIYQTTTSSSAVATAVLFLALDARPVGAPSNWKQIFADAAGFDLDPGDFTSDAQVAAEQHYAPERIRIPLFECSDTEQDLHRGYRIDRRYRNTRNFRRRYKHLADEIARTAPAPVQSKKEPAMQLALGA